MKKTVATLSAILASLILLKVSDEDHFNKVCPTSMESVSIKKVEEVKRNYMDMKSPFIHLEDNDGIQFKAGVINVELLPFLQENKKIDIRMTEDNQICSIDFQK